MYVDGIYRETGKLTSIDMEGDGNATVNAVAAPSP